MTLQAHDVDDVTIPGPGQENTPIDEGTTGAQRRQPAA
jgi:hypothetical protein